MWAEVERGCRPGSGLEHSAPCPLGCAIANGKDTVKRRFQKHLGVLSDSGYKEDGVIEATVHWVG